MSGIILSVAEEKFKIVFKDGGVYEGSSAKGEQLTELEDRLMVTNGNKRTAFLNHNVDYYEVEKEELDKRGLSLEMPINA